MSASFLAVVGERLVDAFPRQSAPVLSSDDVLMVFLHLDLPTRLRVARVNKAFLEASRRPEIYSVCGKSLVSRRAQEKVLLRFAALCLGSSTRVLDLANMRELHPDLLRDLLTRSPSMLSMPNLESLDLSATDLDDQAMVAVREYCTFNGPLRRLYLWATEGISDSGIDSISQQLSRTTAEMRSSLEVVDLRMCGTVTGKGIRGLAKGCPLLKDLRLKGLKGIDDRTFVALGEHCPLLTSLDASGGCDGLTDRGVCALAAGCPRLEQLRLAGNKRVTDVGVAALAAGCAEITLLDLQGCATCGDGAALALAEHSRCLSVVSFQCCALLSDAGFIELCSRCSQTLRHVTIKLCKVTEEAIDEMRAAHSSMTIVSLVCSHSP
jgi:hypothetical protein